MFGNRVYQDFGAFVVVFSAPHRDSDATVRRAPSDIRYGLFSVCGPLYVQGFGELEKETRGYRIWEILSDTLFLFSLSLSC